MAAANTRVTCGIGIAKVRKGMCLAWALMVARKEPCSAKQQCQQLAGLPAWHGPTWRETCGVPVCCQSLQGTNLKPSFGARAALKTLAGAAPARAHDRRLPSYGCHEWQCMQATQTAGRPNQR
jgi:hypothetical protein